MHPDVIATVAGARVYDLAQPMFNEMPRWPNHPPFFMSPYRRHGDSYRACGFSSANEVMVMSGHSGSHMDAIGHVSEHDCLHGGIDAPGAMNHKGLEHHSIDVARPLVARGVLLDIAGLRGAPALAPAEAVTADDLQAAARRQEVSIQAGDVVLVRTGWGAFWDDAARYLPEGGLPGPDASAAQWLAEQKIRATGSDTFTYEVLPDHASSLPVHMILLARNGIHILENLNLEELAAARAYEFLFLAAPLKVTGGTGSPIRPLALL